MRTKGTAAELERRRRRAVALGEQGAAPAVVARILGGPRSSWHRWRRMARQGQDLTAQPLSGAKRRRTDLHLRDRDGRLDQGAPAHGFPNERWTSARVAQVIRRHCGVTDHPDYVRRLLRRRLGWTCPQPQRRARQRNDQEVERGKADEFPRILREAWQRGAHVALLDESGFMLMPLVRRSLARRGQRLFLRCSATPDRLSAIRCVPLSPQAMRVGLSFWFLVNQNFHGEEGVEFLGYLTRKVPGAGTVVGDRTTSPSRSQAVQAWLARHPRVVVEDFPAHDPDANPDEWVWRWATYGKLSNLCPADVEYLFDDVWDALEDLKHQPRLLASFVMDAGVPLCL